MENNQRFKHLFYSKHEKKAQTDQGIGWDLFVEAIIRSNMNSGNYQTPFLQRIFVYSGLNQ